MPASCNTGRCAPCLHPPLFGGTPSSLNGSERSGEIMQREIQQLQIVVAAMMVGLLIFMTIAALLGPLTPEGAQMAWLLLAIPFIAVGCAFGYFSLRRALLEEIRTRRV